MSKIIKLLDERNLARYNREDYDVFLKTQNFEFNIPAVHISGTNGKGSTAYAMMQILMAGGYKVGLYTSPALIKLNEMIQINGEMITDDALDALAEPYLEQLEKSNLSSFEIMSFLAFNYFMNEKVDIAIIEVGMGGAIDATNVFKPLISVITNVSLEHTHYLGTTLEQIVAAKSGIIKEGVPVMIGANLGPEKQLLKEAARAKNAPIYESYSPSDTIDVGIGVAFHLPPYENVFIPNKNKYLAANFALAVSTVDAISMQFPVEEYAVYEAGEHFKLPGRYQKLSLDKKVIVDGAHNPAAMKALIEVVKEEKAENIKVIFAAFKDKDVATELALLGEISEDITLTSFPHQRARRKVDYPFDKYNYIDDYHEAFTSKYDELGKNDLLLVTGSLAFSGLVAYEHRKK